MQTYQKPPGSAAGSDQVDALEESVNAHIEQMFEQAAKRSVLDFGVGRTTTKLGWSDTTLDAKKRECDAQAMFHAGRALELAMHVVYARGADRIMGREFPGVTKAEMNEDRGRGHGLRRSYQQILEDLDGRDMKSAIEDHYQKALHKGIIDIYFNGELVTSFLQPKDSPFREEQIGGIADGVEYTLDHSSHKDLISPRDVKPSKFSQMPYDSFEQFLDKADASYYESDIPDNQGNTKRRDMRWADYSARDHEYGRPYAMVGVEFFARLVKEIITLSHQCWVWEREFAIRFLERNQYIAVKKMEILAKQNLDYEVVFPDPLPTKDVAKLYESLRDMGKDGLAMSVKMDYAIHHTSLRYKSKKEEESS